MSETETKMRSSALELPQAVDRVRRLVIRDLSAPDFFQELIAALCCCADGAIAAAWMISETRSLGLYAEQGLTATGLLSDPDATVTHQKLLIEGCLAAAPLIRPHALGEFIQNDHVLLIPIRKDSRQIGVIELYCGSAQVDAHSDEIVNELTQIAGSVEQFLRRLEDHEQRFDPNQFLKDFDRFVNQLHESLDSRRISVAAANELRLLLSCDRVTLLERSGRRFRALETSGQSQIHRHSRQVKLLEEIVAEVSRTRRQFVFPHGEADLPDRLVRSLSDYLNDSSAQMLLIEPIFDRPAESEGDATSRSVAERRIMAAIVFEQFSDSLPKPILSQNIERCSHQVAVALRNAKRHSRFQKIPGLSIVGGCWQGVTSSRAAVFGLLLTLGMVGVWALCGMEQELKIECRGRLMPAERRHVFATVDGEIAKVFVSESQHVSAGEPLLELGSSELEARILELSSQLRQKLKERDSIRVELRMSVASQTRDQSARLQAEQEIVTSEIATITSQLKLLAAEQDKLLVVAPISGTVTTPRPSERLLRKPVQRGEHLIELMSEQGPWQLELEFPERRAGHLLDRTGDADGVTVDYRLAAFPELVWKGQVGRVSDRTILSQHFGTAIQVICDVDETNLPPRRIGMDVSAQIHCGRRSLIFVYFGELKEYLHRRWWL